MDKYKKIYFLGIGGIGMSALAQYLKHEGREVLGADTGFASRENLVDAGILVYEGYNASRIDKEIDAVVYTLATASDNPEFLKAKELKIPLFTYAEMLGKVSEDKKTIAISGTHGKTTTTAMVAKILIDAALEPAVIVGSLFKDPTVYQKEKRANNFIAGNSNIFVVEACEYRRSFLNLKPHIMVVTNIDMDHLDYYKDLADIESAFVSLVGKMSKGDYLICNKKEQSLQPVIDEADKKNVIVLDYSEIIEKFKMLVPGNHNQQNAKAAFLVGKIFGISDEKIRASLAGFAGTWRRFEYRGELENGAKLYDDYGHHPTEIKATLAGARELFPDKNIIAVFQPHLYSRTKLLFSDFAQSFVDVDKVILAPIYAAREQFDPSISSEILSDEINKTGKTSEVGVSLEDIADKLKSSGPDDVIITIGAGDINKVIDFLK